MVFEPSLAPKKGVDFLEWYRKQAEWSEAHNYDDPVVSSPKLQAWFHDIITLYPPMNGPFSQEDLPEDEASLTDYSIG